MFLHGVHLVENTNDDCFETNIASSGSLLGLKQADKPCMRAISLERQLADIPSLDQVVRKPVAEAFQYHTRDFAEVGFAAKT